MSGGGGFLRGKVAAARRASTEIQGNSEVKIGVGEKKRGDKKPGAT
jgi:hypothetical protein